MNLENERIWICGANGMVGTALRKRLRGCQVLCPTRNELDLTDFSAVNDWVRLNEPTVVFNAAALVGGIEANRRRPVDFLLQNLKIQNNIFEIAHIHNIKKMLFFGSACSFPKDAPQPIKEEYFMGGPPEDTNIWYATAKIAGIQLAQAYREQHNRNFICVMPTNTFGPGDNFNESVNHVIPALMKRFYKAKKNNQYEVVIWGSGRPLREFLFVDDLADASVFLMENYSDRDLINIGSGQEISILTLAKKVAQCVGYEGKIEPDLTKPDGAQRKLLDSSRLAGLGWNAHTKLEDGLKETFEWALSRGYLD